jgi:hypothetical protein
MSSVDWMPELAAALDELVPAGDGSRADWHNVVGRVRRRRRWPLGQHRGLRLAIVVAVLLLLLAGVATATYLLVRGDSGLAFGGGELMVVNPNSQHQRAIARCAPADRGCGIYEAAWSPDGTRVAFLAGYYLGGAGLVKSHMFLYVENANGAGVRRLALCGICGHQDEGQHLSWSPNGRWIAFSRDAGPTQGFQSLWIVAAAGGKPRRITDCHASCSDVEPLWSPDGRLIAFEHGARAASGLYTVRPDGSHRTRVADVYGEPAWSPDGRRIAFDYGPDSLAVANADGSHLGVLLKGSKGSGPGAPSWSPNGRALVFLETTRRRPHSGYRYEVWTMRADGSGKERLYRSPCCLFLYASPIWSPNGRQIAFSFGVGPIVSARAANGTYVVNADGTGLRRVSDAIPDTLSWEPAAKGRRHGPQSTQRRVAIIHVAPLPPWHPWVPGPTRRCLLRHHAQLRPSNAWLVRWIVARNRSGLPSAWITMSFVQSPSWAAIQERGERSYVRTAAGVGAASLRHHLTRRRNVVIYDVFHGHPLTEAQLATITDCLRR